MDKAAIFVSDLHLGRGDELDDFRKQNEDAFIRFLEQQSLNFLSWDVDLVILGDFLDIWQVATNEEKVAPDTEKVDLSLLNGLERQRVQQIIEAHSETFSALGVFLAAEPTKRRLVLVTGNHDHSFVDDHVQQIVQTAIAGANAELASRIVFSHYYDSPDLFTYAEHGCQFDPNNDYNRFSQFGEECPGFYFVRLFWNRLESMEPKLDEWDWWNAFKAIWENNDLLYLVRPAVNFFRQYRNDPRSFERIDVPGVPFFAATGEKPTVRRLPEFPDVLVSDKLVKDPIFSTDPFTENRLRSLYYDPSQIEFKAAVDEILSEKFSGQIPPVPKPGPPVPEFGFLYDEYENAVAGLFAPLGEKPQVMPMKGSALSPDIYKYVLLGHTHADKEAKVDDEITYFNTGTWTGKRNSAGGNISQLCFVIVQKPMGGETMAVRYHWS